MTDTFEAALEKSRPSTAVAAALFLAIQEAHEKNLPAALFIDIFSEGIEMHRMAAAMELCELLQKGPKEETRVSVLAAGFHASVKMKQKVKRFYLLCEGLLGANWKEETNAPR